MRLADGFNRQCEIAISSNKGFFWEFHLIIDTYPCLLIVFLRGGDEMSLKSSKDSFDP